MTKKQGGHYKWNEVKSYILKHILENKGPIREPDIRKYLKRSCEIIDQGTINRHLHDLQDSMGCIERNKTLKKGLANYWDVKTIKNLKNIRYHFPDIPLNNYAKSINIIFRESGLDIGSPYGIKLYARSLLSVSFFDMTMATGIENIQVRTWKMYLYGDGFEKIHHIRKLIDDFYTTYIENNLNFKMNMNEFVENIEQFSYNDDEISASTWGEKFRGLEKEMSRETFLVIEDEISQNDNLLNKIREERVYEILEEKQPGWKSRYDFNIFRIINEQIPEIIRDREDEIKEKLFLRIYEEEIWDSSREKETNKDILLEKIKNDRKMYLKIDEIISVLRKERVKFETSRYDLLLQHCFNHDILTGVASTEELEFMANIKKNFTEFIDSSFDPHTSKDAGKKWILNDLKIISEILVKYQQPLPSGNVYKKQEEAYMDLIEFLGYKHLLE